MENRDHLHRVTSKPEMVSAICLDPSCRQAIDDPSAAYPGYCSSRHQQNHLKLKAQWAEKEAAKDAPVETGALQ